jgi:hypothetical protein
MIEKTSTMTYIAKNNLKMNVLLYTLYCECSFDVKVVLMHIFFCYDTR